MMEIGRNLDGLSGATCDVRLVFFLWGGVYEKTMVVSLCGHPLLWGSVYVCHLAFTNASLVSIIPLEDFFDIPSLFLKLQFLPAIVDFILWF